MCPVCIATAAVIAGSATGTGGLTAFVATAIFKLKFRSKFPEQTEAEEVHDGDHHNRTEKSESGFAQ
jgi:hypothetical protein